MSRSIMSEPGRNFGIYCMSYKRADQIKTKYLFEYCTYVVREEEAEQYRAAGIDDMLIIPKGEAWSYMSTLYWILSHTPEDVVFVADDDVDKFVYRMFDTTYLETKDGMPDKEKITSEVERIGQLVYDLGIGYAFDQPSLAPYNYDAEFHFVGIPGHLRWINKTKLKAKYNMNDYATQDVDMEFQELLYNRICLQPRYLCVKAAMDTNAGEQKARKQFLVKVEALKNKWGKYYDYDARRNIPKIRVKR